MKTIYAFDFDGTITPIPGEYSEMYHEGFNYRNEAPDTIAERMKHIMNRYLTPENVHDLKTFFDILHNQENTILTIQTNNFRNVVIACLVHHIGIPIEYFDLEKSCFRECRYTKQCTIAGLTYNPVVERIIYFDDSTDYINIAMHYGPKIAVVNCCDGTHFLGELLKSIPVIDEKSLNLFLEQNVTYSDSQENLIELGSSSDDIVFTTCCSSGEEDQVTEVVNNNYDKWSDSE